jgi:prepilin-type N-terminal cleavage/methylation domain-containing protein
MIREPCRALRMDRKRRMTRRDRAGVSLVELLVVISIAGVIIGVSMLLLHTLLRTERDQTRSVRSSLTLSRLSRMFREDVHSSESIEIINGTVETRDRLTMTSRRGNEISYSADEHVLERVEQAGGAEIHRDLFHLPPGSAYRFERDTAPDIVRVAIEIAAAIPDHFPEAARGKDRRPPPRSLAIEALLGRDHRFSGRQP